MLLKKHHIANISDGKLYLGVATESILGTALVALGPVKEETAPCVFSEFSRAAKNETAETN